MFSKEPSTQRLGKAHAREKFSPLIDSLATNGGVVEITNYGKTTAVLMGYKEYLSLVAKAASLPKPTRQLRGSGKLIGNLEDATNKISKAVAKSIEQTIAKL